MIMTPWGEAQQEEAYSPYITFYTTAGHGGFYLHEAANKHVPKRYREFAAKWSKGWGDQWYEEDCAALAVVVTFHALFPGINYDEARKQLESYVRG